MGKRPLNLVGASASANGQRLVAGVDEIRRPMIAARPVAVCLLSHRHERRAESDWLPEQPKRTRLLACERRRKTSCMTAKCAEAASQSSAKGRADVSGRVPERGNLSPEAQVANAPYDPRYPVHSDETSEGSLSAVVRVQSAGLLICQEHLARIIAAGMGPESSAASAVKELDERRARGERVCVLPKRGQWVVEPI